MISNLDPAGGPEFPELPSKKPNPFTAHLDSGNFFAVGAAKMEIMEVIELQINFPVPCRLGRFEALNLAAWIVALVDPQKKQLDQLLQEIQKT